MTTEPTQATETTPSASSTWYAPSPTEFSAMTSEERTAALERSYTEQAAYMARKAAAGAP